MYHNAGGIIAWLALGPHMDFGDEWQLNVNTATAVELMVMTTFLQNTKRRHRRYMHRCLALLAGIDDELEQRLLAVTQDEDMVSSEAGAVKVGWASLRSAALCCVSHTHH